VQGKETDMECNLFLRKLKTAQQMLTVQQYRTLKGQALAGDVVGAERGLLKIIGRGVEYAH
jgi:hypothetical protein